MVAQALKQFETLARERPLTDVIAWSRMQAEAGQDLSAIILRKEREREAGEGLFCWGVGNAPSRSVGSYVRLGAEIDAVFSIMKSRPKAIDESPSGVIVWRSYFDADGIERALPPASLITSRATTASKVKTSHFALMCRSERPLELTDHGPFDPQVYRNVSESGGAIGNSQVTALLRRVGVEDCGGSYRVNLRAKLTSSYWVRLGDPLDLGSSRRQKLDRDLLRAREMSCANWLELVADVREGAGRAIGTGAPQPQLF